MCAMLVVCVMMCAELGGAQITTYMQYAYHPPAAQVLSPYLQPPYLEPFVLPGQIYMPSTYVDFDVPGSQVWLSHTQRQTYTASHPSILTSFAKACPHYAEKGWWGRFISVAAQDVGKLNKFKDVDDVVFAMNAASLAKLCNSKHMDDVLLGIGYPASTIADMKTSSPGGQPMTLVVWDGSEIPLDRATWQHVLKSADKQLDDRLLKVGQSRGPSLPKFHKPKWEKKLNARTSPERTFQFGARKHGVVPVDGESMNLDIAIKTGFAVDDEQKFIAQLRSFLANELSCNADFKGDGFTWHYDEDSNAWADQKGEEYLACNFDVRKTGLHHHEITVNLPWLDAFNQVCEDAVRKGWWGRFVAASVDDIRSLDRHKDAGDVVFVMDSGLLATTCRLTYMDEILEVLHLPAEVVADMKRRAPDRQPMTLVVWSDDEHYLDPATWRNVLRSADEQLDARLKREGRERIGFPTFAAPKHERALDHMTSPRRLFRFGESKYRTGSIPQWELDRVMPVNAEFMNLNIAMQQGFDMHDNQRLLAQMRSFLYNEVGCHRDFKGDGFNWLYDDKTDAWVSAKHAEYLAHNFDVMHLEASGDGIHHREVPVALPWRP